MILPDDLWLFVCAFLRESEKNALLQTSRCYHTLRFEMGTVVLNERRGYNVEAAQRLLNNNKVAHTLRIRLGSKIDALWPHLDTSRITNLRIVKMYDHYLQSPWDTLPPNLITLETDHFPHFDIYLPNVKRLKVLYHIGIYRDIFYHQYFPNVVDLTIDGSRQAELNMLNNFPHLERLVVTSDMAYNLDASHLWENVGKWWPKMTDMHIRIASSNEKIVSSSLQRITTRMRYSVITYPPQITELTVTGFITPAGVKHLPRQCEILEIRNASGNIIKSILFHLRRLRVLRVRSRRFVDVQKYARPGLVIRSI